MKPQLDRTDYELLALLQKNARHSNKDLAARVGLAESTCLERVRRLISSGFIRGFHADVDSTLLGARLQALVMVRMEKHLRPEVEAFRDHVLALPEVVDVYLVSGLHDFMIHVVVPDADYLRELLLSQITIRPEVVHVETTLIFQHWRDHVVPGFLET